MILKILMWIMLIILLWEVFRFHFGQTVLDWFQGKVEKENDESGLPYSKYIKKYCEGRDDN